MVSSEQININITLIDLSKIPHKIAREAQLAQINYNKPVGCGWRFSPHRVSTFSYQRDSSKHAHRGQKKPSSCRRLFCCFAIQFSLFKR
jgi:hypothetical protein